VAPAEQGMRRAQRAPQKLERNATFFFCVGFGVTFTAAHAVRGLGNRGRKALAAQIFRSRWHSRAFEIRESITVRTRLEELVGTVKDEEVTIRLCVLDV